MSNEPTRYVTVTDETKEAIKAATKGQGGFQSFNEKLLRQINGDQLAIYEDDEEKGSRYAHDYGNGGWEDLLGELGF